MRYLPPVYSRLSIGTICVAAATVGMGKGEEYSRAATAALEALYPGYRATLLDSGTSALTVALGLALTDTARREEVPLVALPAYACPDLATAAVAVNARICLFDLDPHTLEPDLASIMRCLNRGARVVVVAHLYGRVTDTREIQTMCDRFGAVLVEDAAQHAGGHVAGIRGGSQANLSVLSFGRGKGINAGGGGALLVRSSRNSVTTELNGSTNGIRPLMGSFITELLSTPVLYGVPARIPCLGVGDTRYHAPAEITAMPHALAFVLHEALCNEQEELRRRRAREAEYYEALEARATFHTGLFSRSAGSGALRTPVTIAPAWAQQHRDTLAPLGVVRSYPRTLAEYPEVVSRLAPSKEPPPGAVHLAARVHTLPTHRYVHDRDARDIVNALSRA